MPQNRRTYKLKHLTTKIGSGSTPRGGDSAYISEGISLIRSQNVLDFVFSLEGLAHIDEQQAHDLRSVTIEKGDVLINITGDSVARVSQVPDEILPARVNQHVAILRANQEVLDPKFLKYSLLSPESKSNLLSQSSSGATRKALTKVMLEDFEINLPSIEEQQAIAEILSALDDKIELNLQTNKTLEEMANALYKHWFVDFGPFKNGKFVESELGLIPEGWFIKTVGAIGLDISDGNYSSKYPTNDEFVKEGIPFIRAVNMKNGILVRDDLRYITKEKHSEITKGHLKSGDILVVSRGTIGETARVPDYFEHANINAQLVRINGRNVLPNSFLYLAFISRQMQDEMKANTSGTALQQLPIGSLTRLSIILPPKEVLEAFDKNVCEWFSCIDELTNEIHFLKQTRDYLLPKLISGEIRVKDAAQSLKELI